MVGPIPFLQGARVLGKFDARLDCLDRRLNGTTILVSYDYEQLEMERGITILDGSEHDVIDEIPGSSLGSRQRTAGLLTPAIVPASLLNCRCILES